MRAHLIFIVGLMTSVGMAQIGNGKVTPRVRTMDMESGDVTVLHLGPGFATSLKLPEEVSSIVIGDPRAFRAEHSEAEPRLVFLKPITTDPCESNATITTRSGQEVTLHLLSAGKASAGDVDFFIEYRRPQSLVIDADTQSLLIAERGPIFPVTSIGAAPIRAERPDAIATELEAQKRWSFPVWEGTELMVALGKSTQRNDQTIVGFSVLNNSKRVIELLPPQIELSDTGQGRGAKKIRAEPVAITEYRMTARQAEPGQRIDGVVVFERPAFKDSREQLQLRLAEAERVDRPMLLPVPFTATSEEAAQ